MGPLGARLSLLAVAALAGGGLLFGLLGACAHDWDVYLPPAGAGANNAGGSGPGANNPGGGGEGGRVLVGECPGNAGPAPLLVRVPTSVAAGGTTPGVRAECIGETEVTRGQYEQWLNSGVMPEPSEIPAPCQNHPDASPQAAWPPGGVGLDEPVAFVDWCDAAIYCLAQGQRLCGVIGGGPTGWGDYTNAGVSEWFNACTDRGHHGFPYGDAIDLARCRDNSDAGPVDVKSMSGCRTSTGVYDLSGNVWEWEDSCMSDAVDAGCRQRGGGYNNYTASDLGCAANASYQRTQGTIAIGFRCCADPI